MILLFIVLLFLAIYPVGMALVHLYRYSHHIPGEATPLRAAIFRALFANFIALLAEMIAGILALARIQVNPYLFVIMLFIAPVMIQAVANWWAWWTIRKLI